MSAKAIYNVTTFGEFTISFRSRKVNDQSNRSKKPWNLLEYLVVNCDRTIPQEELLDLLWDEDSSDNPQGALKVLLHRVRKSLEVLNPETTEFIVLKRGEYAWKPEGDTVFDCRQFEELCESASDKTRSSVERIGLYKQAFEIYKGDFLPRNGESWVIPIRDYYHSIFIKAVLEAVEIYNEESKYQEIIALCRKAIAVEKVDEKLYYHLISALYKAGQQAEALKEYSNSTDMFYKEFGITPSAQLKSLYKVIAKSTKNLETDINIIKEALQEEGEATGAFECEYEFFKDIYQLEARACARSGDSIYLCLITLNSTSDQEPTIKVMNRAMSDALLAINETLRKGDVVARYSVSQYVLLLPTAAFENVESIMKRISSTFYRKHMKKDISLQYKLLPLDPKR